MTDIPNNIERRQELRYEVAAGHTVKTVVQRSTDTAEETINGELRNLSPGGAQICLSTYPQFAEVVQLRVVVPDAKVNIDVTAEICWIRPMGDDECLVGCSFLLKISDAVIERLAAAGIIDRRRFPRHEISVPAIARWELDAEECSVRITDYSEGGFCMMSDRPGTVGAVVSVEVDAKGDGVAPISGRVCWQETRDGKHYLGCSMKSPEDFAQLHDLCGVTDSEHETTTPSSARKSSRLFVAAMWLFMFVGSMLVGLKAISSWHRPPIALANGRHDAVGFVRLVDTEVATTDETTNVNPSDSTEPDKQTNAIASDTFGIAPIASRKTVPERPAGTDHKLNTHSSANTNMSSTSDSVRADGVSPFGFRRNQDASLDTNKLVRPQLAHPNQVTSAPRAITAGLEKNTKAQEAFVFGDRFYRDGHFANALGAFQTAVALDSQNALYCYLLAMTHYQLSQFQKAETAVQHAIQLEQEWPVENWGSRLSRYQGLPRLWVEQLRSAATNDVQD